MGENRGLGETGHKAELVAKRKITYRDLVDMSNDLIWTLDRDNRLVFLNQRATRTVYGYEPEEMLGRYFSDFQHPEFVEKRPNEFERYIQKGKSFTFETEHIRKDRKTVKLRFEVIVFKRADGKIIGAAGTAFDITKRKMIQNEFFSAYRKLKTVALTRTVELRAANEALSREVEDRKETEIALSRSEEKYRLLIENATDAIFIVQDGKLNFSNPRAFEIFTPLEFDETFDSFLNHVDSDSRDTILSSQERLLAGGEEAAHVEFKLNDPHSREIWVQMNSVFIEWEEKPATLNYLRDVTHSKQIEAQLRQAQKMEAIGTLAGGLAHDFNNLLMAIQGNVSLLLLEYEKDPRLHELLRNIEQKIEHGSQITSQLLGYVRKGKSQQKTFDLNRLVSETAESFGRIKKDASIYFDLATDLWSVISDRGQIEQVLLNLFINAGDAMPDGGNLFLASKNVTDYETVPTKNISGPGRYVKLTIRDTGQGISPENLDRIFDPFFTTKGMGLGSGLGLTSSYGIIKNHNGNISVNSQVGEGTVFEILLPAAEGKCQTSHEKNEAILKGSGTILIADDEEMILEIAVKMLEKLGYTVFKACNGREALEIYKCHSDGIDLVILDMVMPGISGGEAYDRIKEINPQSKILLASGYSADGKAREILNRGCDGFIQKPFNLEKLAAKVGKIVKPVK